MAISRFIRSIESGEAIPFFGDGSSRRDYTYIDDIADGVEAALDRGAPASGFEIVNLGGAHPVTLSELVAAIEQATGRKAILDRQPLQPGDVPVTYASVEKAERLLGFRARVTLADGLRRTLDWFRNTAARGPHEIRSPGGERTER
ncbi:MAG TPA: GDP-mannose 4,6-dehydratase, partial [Thermoanaerobaculia bacterium]|nr:GDP-mannose 4,6-dehydratase [Thermoanaerobaculia bacterium]